MAINKVVNKIKQIWSFLWNRKKLLVLIIVVIAVAFWRLSVLRDDGGVETTEIKKGDVYEELILSGEINADEYASLAFQASGKISWIGVSEGDDVKKGQFLARLDASNLSMDLKIADATLRRAASTLDRVYDDLEDSEGDESFSEIETRTAAETTKDAAVFSHIKAQKNLGNATLIAPFDGIVSAVANPFSGVNVLFSQTQIEVVNPETIFFEVSADQNEVVDLSVGQKVIIVLDSFLDKEFEGEIIFISYTPMTGEVGAVYKVKVGFPVDILDLQNLRIGMTGDAKFVLSEKPDVLFVPPEYLNSDTKGKYLKLGKKNNKVYIDVGLEGEERIEVSGEIKEGDTVYD